MYLSVGKRGFPLNIHSYSGSGYPPTKAVNLAAMPLNTISSPIFLRNSGASDLPFSMNSTISNCPLEDPEPSLLLAKHSKIPIKIKYVLESIKSNYKLNQIIICICRGKFHLIEGIILSRHKFLKRQKSAEIGVPYIDILIPREVFTLV